MPLLGSIIKRAYALRNKPIEKKLESLNASEAQREELRKLIRNFPNY
jgi:hypothetical protein